MKRLTLIGLSLALLSAPLKAAPRAHRSGQPCVQAQITAVNDTSKVVIHMEVTGADSHAMGNEIRTEIERVLMAYYEPGKISVIQFTEERRRYENSR